jgi:xylose isomerase
MDAFARAAIIAEAVLQKSPYKQFRKDRYASFDSGAGAEFEGGRLKLEDLRDFAIQNGEPKQSSGKQEWLENIINSYI